MKLNVDMETGEVLPVNVMVQTDKAPAVVIDINDVAIYHAEPEKLVEKIRDQAGFAVFDISNEKGRAACRSHAANIIKCIAPAINASKALAADAQKVVKQDLTFRRIFEADVREIAEFHRKPLTEYEAELQRVKDEFEALEAAKLAEEARIKHEAEEEARRIFEAEKAELAAEKLAIEQEKQRQNNERERIELENRLREEAEERRLIDEKRHAEQLARQAQEDEQERARLAEKAEADKIQAVKDATEKAESETKQREQEKLIAEQQRLEAIKLEGVEQERKAALAPDKEKLVKLGERIAAINIPEVGEDAKKITDEVVILLEKVRIFIAVRSAKL